MKLGYEIASDAEERVEESPHGKCARIPSTSKTFPWISRLDLLTGANGCNSVSPSLWWERSVMCQIDVSGNVAK